VADLKEGIQIVHADLEAGGNPDKLDRGFVGKVSGRKHGVAAGTRSGRASSVAEHRRPPESTVPSQAICSDRLPSGAISI